MLAGPASLSNVSGRRGPRLAHHRAFRPCPEAPQKQYRDAVQLNQRFTGSCNFGEKFNSQQIVFDTTFCGDWAGATFTDQCGGVAKSCEAYVADTPNAFVDAYWSVKSLRVYQDNGAAKSAPSVASSSAAHPGPSQPAHSGGTRPSVAPSGPPETSRAPGKPTGTKAPQSSPANDHHHERPTHSGWHAPSHTWGGQGPWRSDGWNDMQVH